MFSKTQTTPFKHFFPGERRNIGLEFLSSFSIQNNPTSLHSRAPPLARRGGQAQSVFVESGPSLIRGKKSKVTQGKVVLPVRLQQPGLKPEKAAIDFCSLLPRCSNVPGGY
jgi:hypothetical protein